MIIGRALVRIAVEGVGADLRRRTWLVRGPRPLTEVSTCYFYIY